MKSLNSILATVLIMISSIPPTQALEITNRQTQTYVLDKLRQNDLVFMGTTHKQPPILSLIAGLLPRLHLSGVTHLALEVASDQQPSIDRYLSTGRGLDDIELHQAIDCPEYRRLMMVLRQIPAQQRPRVLAIDLPPVQYGGAMGRDAFMAVNLAEILEGRPGVKILAVLGSLHVLRQLSWLPGITHGHAAIRTHLSQRLPELRIFSMVNIADSGNMQSDFYSLAPDSGTTALDLNLGHRGWRLGITDSLSVQPSQPYDLVDGVIVH